MTGTIGPTDKLPDLEVYLMRLTIPLILILAAVVFIGISLSEQPQTATANSSSDGGKSGLCSSVVEPVRTGWITTFGSGQLMFSGEPEITKSLPWHAIFHSHAPAPARSTPLILGLPPESGSAAAPGQSASAATVDVNVIDDFFSPSTVSINVGDTVHWV